MPSYCSLFLASLSSLCTNFLKSFLFLGEVVLSDAQTPCVFFTPPFQAVSILLVLPEGIAGARGTEKVPLCHWPRWVFQDDLWLSVLEGADYHFPIRCLLLNHFLLLLYYSCPSFLPFALLCPSYPLLPQYVGWDSRNCWKHSPRTFEGWGISAPSVHLPPPSSRSPSLILIDTEFYFHPNLH